MTPEDQGIQSVLGHASSTSYAGASVAAGAVATTTTPVDSRRVILLLDLDCFYAQCECLRLGFDSSQTPLALLQWNSVLAVTYPARALGIQRGDTWETVLGQTEPSRCWAVHVPVLSTKGNTVTTSECANQPEEQSFQYSDIYNLSALEQEVARKRDLNQRHYATEGKACIERYRIASTKIFETVMELLTRQFPQQSVILEKASIDEFFLDVTKAVQAKEFILSDHSNSLTEIMEETCRIGEQEVGTAAYALNRGTDERDDEYHLWLLRACWIARQIRRTVYDTLGFTLSCGISVNKTTAKLAASYGKPNGQAVCFPHAIDYMLEQTPIRKCRNLGGKLGKTVAALLPPNVTPTVGAIRRYLSIPELERVTGDASVARWVFDLCRGIDRQPVQAKDANSAAFTKSITAFKSLFEGHGLLQIEPWVRLLAQEVITRVDQVRKRRYPRTCTIQYSFVRRPHNKNASARVDFPAENQSDKVQLLVQSVLKKLEDKEGNDVLIQRIGLCATEFITKMASIEKFVRSKAIKDVTDVAEEEEEDSVHNVSTKGPKCPVVSISYDETSDVVLAKKLQADYDCERRLLDASSTRSSVSLKLPPFVVEPGDEDRRLAEKLQAEFDRENRLLEAAERTKQKRKLEAVRSKRCQRIDQFFQAKNKKAR